MNLNQTEYILAIAAEGSLSGAARALGISQPALSKYLNALEKEFGMEMFTRDKKRMKPTQAGMICLDAARRIRSAMQETDSRIKALSITEKKALSIGLSPHQGALVLAQIYPQMLKHFPGITLKLYEGYTRRLYEALKTGKTDYLMTSVMEDEKNVHILPIQEEETLLAVPEYHNLSFLASGTPDDYESLACIDLRQLQDAPFVLMDRRTTSIGALSRRILEDEQIDPMVVLESDNGYLVKEMIQAGVGVGFLPYHYARETSHVSFFRMKKSYRFAYCVATREGYRMSKEERYFTYLQLKGRETDRNVHYLWSDEAQAITEEFELDPDWPLLSGWRFDY